MVTKKQLQEIGALKSTDSSMVSIFSSGTTKEGLLKELKLICIKIKNIKDSYKRKKINGVISSVFDYLEDNTVPKNVAIFAATLKGGVAFLEVLTIPKRVDFEKFQYFCDFDFKTDLVIEELWPSDKIGVALVFAKQTLLYEFNLTAHKAVEKVGLTKGSSRSDYVSKAKAAVDTAFTGKDHIIGHIVAGPGNLKNEFPGKKMDCADRVVIGALKKELDNVFIKTKYSKDIAHLEEIFANIDQPKVVYGLKEIAQQLEYQQLQILYTNRVPKIDTGNCRVVHLPKELKELRLKVKDFGGAIGWKYY
jgi:hypothetical protein